MGSWSSEAQGRGSKGEIRRGGEGQAGQSRGALALALGLGVAGTLEVVLAFFVDCGGRGAQSGGTLGTFLDVGTSSGQGQVQRVQAFGVGWRLVNCLTSLRKMQTGTSHVSINRVRGVHTGNGAVRGTLYAVGGTGGGRATRGGLPFKGSRMVCTRVRRVEYRELSSYPIVGGVGDGSWLGRERPRNKSKNGESSGREGEWTRGCNPSFLFIYPTNNKNAGKHSQSCLAGVYSSCVVEAVTARLGTHTWPQSAR